jgi:hypothetical protein
VRLAILAQRRGRATVETMFRNGVSEYGSRSQCPLTRIGHCEAIRYFPWVKPFLDRAAIVFLALALSACATNAVVAATAPAGTRFSDRGKITLHRGEPCTSQIMFDFHPVNGRSTVWLAAGAHDSKKLTDAARIHRAVRVSGTWRRGHHPGCAYVDVEKMAVEATWWNKLFKP